MTSCLEGSSSKIVHNFRLAEITETGILGLDKSNSANINADTNYTMDFLSHPVHKDPFKVYIISVDYLYSLDLVELQEP